MLTSVEADAATAMRGARRLHAHCGKRVCCDLQRDRNTAGPEDLDACARAYGASSDEIRNADCAALREQLAQTFEVDHLVFLAERVLETP